jgi:hypothetical protein
MRPAYRTAICIVLLAGFETIGTGQAAIPPGPDNFYIGTPAGWVQPKTPWGDPDLQGIYPENFVGSVPMQRCVGRQRPGAPPCDPHQAFYTEEQFKAAQARYAKAPDRYQQAEEQGQAGREFLRGVTDPTPPQRQTAFIFDPPDGKLPALTPEGKRVGDEMKSSWPVHGEHLVFNSYEDFDLKDRCVTHGMPASMFPFHYNNGIQIFQAPGEVVILIEMIHEVRIIPLNDNTPVPATVQDWLGFSHGHWEGNTLVVETTNVKPGSMMVNSAMPGTPRNHIPTSEAMKITERFTRINNDYLIYQITVDDPVVMAHSWTARMPWHRDQSYKLLEYACHEDNRMVRDWIKVSQAEQEGKTASKVQAPQQ